MPSVDTFVNWMMFSEEGFLLMSIFPLVIVSTLLAYYYIQSTF